MQALHAESLLQGQKFCRRGIGLLFSRRFFSGPVKIRPVYEIRQPDAGDPFEIRLAGIVHALHAGLLPETFQRRHDVIEIAFDAVVPHLAHLDGIRDAVQDFQRLLIGAARLVRVTFAPDGDKLHGRHGHDGRAVLRQIKLFIFFLEIERHRSLLSADYCYFV